MEVVRQLAPAVAPRDEGGFIEVEIQGAWDPVITLVRSRLMIARECPRA